MKGGILATDATRDELVAAKGELRDTGAGALLALRFLVAFQQIEFSGGASRWKEHVDVVRRSFGIAPASMSVRLSF